MGMANYQMRKKKNEGQKGNKATKLEEINNADYYLLINFPNKKDKFHR
jgi:hypothetical protein